MIPICHGTFITYSAIPFNSTAHPRLEIADYGQAILDNHLLGLQVGDQPDLYATQGLRPYVRETPIVHFECLHSHYQSYRITARPITQPNSVN